MNAVPPPDAESSAASPPLPSHPRRPAVGQVEGHPPGGAGWVSRAFVWLARRSPGTRAGVGKILGQAAWLFVRRRRQVVLRNLALTFPDLSVADRHRLARDHFRALAQSIVDRSVLWYGDAGQVRDLVSLSGLQHLQDAVARGPVIMLAPHFIGLDAGASRLSLDMTAASMYQVQSDPGFDDLFRQGRGRFNEIHLISRREGLRALLRHLKNRLPVYYLPDMDFGERDSVFVPFFGVPTATLTAPAQIARNWNAQMLPILTYWDPATGRYHTEILPPLPDFPGEDTLEDATARLNRLIEDWILACPSQYYWVHKRFKTRPPGVADVYD